MKNVHCLFYFCNLFIHDSSRKTYYNLRIKKIPNNVERNRLYDIQDDHYNYLEKSRNNEYEDILNEIIYEYEEESHKRKKEEQKRKEELKKREEIKKKEDEGKEKIYNNKTNEKSNDIYKNEKNTNLIPDYFLKNTVQEDETPEKEKDENSSMRDEIKRIERFKENNILNLCNLNYDILNLLLKNELKNINNEDESDNQYNKISLFLETQINRSKGEENLYIDDSVGRYFVNIDKDMINSITEKELHFLKNEIYRNVIFLKYKYLKSYKTAIHNLKQEKKVKTKEINKHVSVVYEDNDNEESLNDDVTNGKNNNNDDKDSDIYNDDDHDDDHFSTNNKSVSNESDNNNLSLEQLEKIDQVLSMQNVQEIIDANQRLNLLKKNYEDLKNFNIFEIIDKNKFLNNFKIKNINFYQYSCSELYDTMNKFVKGIKKKGKDKNDSDDNDKNLNDNKENKNKQNDNNCDNNNNNNNNNNNILEHIQNNFSYICIPKINDFNFFKEENKSIVINLSTNKCDMDNDKKKFPSINELNIETKKGILVLSAHDNNIQVSVRNICDKISYLTQSFVICPHINYKENYLENKKIILRIIMLMLFYFNIKHMYVICLDNESSMFLYNFLNTYNNDYNITHNDENNNLFRSLLFDKNESYRKTNYNNIQDDNYVYAKLNEIKFSHIFNDKFVPLFPLKDIFKNYVFLMNKEKYFFDISFFKRSCLFMFLDEHANKKNHVKSTSVQHFFYYKKFDYPYIYNVDNNYCINTLKRFNEILLYLTSWIDIFHTSEEEQNDSQEGEQLNDEDEQKQKDQQTNEQDDEMIGDAKQIEDEYDYDDNDDEFDVSEEGDMENRNYYNDNNELKSKGHYGNSKNIRS
ncbi:hypothetical protein PFUGPA_04901 [Plasmodium falciparum Palo Alto/Uganda]|uniref:Uncharacterized protein n=3 Tax=Plasmodium falciparum TaxID=5833 RepID=W4ITZ4_PLAFP|nr:hypothetical protein PFFCH_05220 [Plasmodium falciparum FCH/4]ETW53274.1 hypothetical protein PFUGPA_04901 [Plasmodium falciparum Palo Alto/Uganda]ETW62822.1 hypothetical protein PFMC_01342 [Plasmodium falciparum CAMP/Malaysia]